MQLHTSESLVDQGVRQQDTGPGTRLLGSHGEAYVSPASEVDYLTGAATREHFIQVLEQQLLRLETGSLSRVCALFIDLDRFKQVNDTLGHLVGDDLLRLVSSRLRGELSAGDVLARLGGDEFAILLPAAPEKDVLSAFVQRLIDLVQRTYLIEGHVVHVGASIGVAQAPEHGATCKELLRRSDLALYAAKDAGRGTYRFFTPELEAKADTRRADEIALRKALALRQMVMLYQPQPNVETGAVTELKALLHWRHPKQGLLPAADFMPLAEKICMTVPIGEWALKTICSEARKWPDSLVFAMQVSALQFEHADFLASVLGALKKAGISGGRLEIEVTEEVLLRNHPNLRETVEALQKHGVKVTLDDFGTGVASLSQLAKLPFDKIKIDRSLIDLERSNARDRAIVRAISALGESLGVKTYAEGVESTAHLAQVRAEGCHGVQGFAWSEAVAADQLKACLAGSSSGDEQPGGNL